MLTKKRVSKLRTINIVKEICQNKNRIFLEIYSKRNIIKKASKNNVIVPTNNSHELILKSEVDKVKGLGVDVLLKYQLNICKRIAITMFTINKA